MASDSPTDDVFLWHETPKKEGATITAKWTPSEPAVSRNQVNMRERMRQHRFYQKFASDTCAVSHQYSVRGGLVQVAHMLPFRGARSVTQFEYAFGYPYLRSLNPDTRMNGMFLWLDIHRMLDTDNFLILFPRTLLNRVRELVYENLEKPLTEREFLPHILDQEMPVDGWEYDMIFRFADGWELILRHQLQKSSSGKLVSSEAAQLHPASGSLSLKTATNPLFVLSNFYEHIENVKADDPTCPYPSGDFRERVGLMSALALEIAQRPLPDEFKPINRLEKLRGGTGKATYVRQLPAYNYMTGRFGERPASFLRPPSRECTPEPEDEPAVVNDESPLKRRREDDNDGLELGGCATSSNVGRVDT